MLDLLSQVQANTAWVGLHEQIYLDIHSNIDSYIAFAHKEGIRLST